MSSGPFVVHPHGDRWAVASVDGVLIITNSEREALALAADAAAILGRKWPQAPRRADEVRSFAPKED
ncbi:MAG: hypothetical protein ABW063_13575 [Caulobacter sp.]